MLGIMKLLVVTWLGLSAAFAAPAPFPVDDEVVIPDSQVEVLGGPVRSGGDGIFPSGVDPGVRVIVVRRPSFSDFPFFGEDEGEQGEAGFGDFNPFSFFGGRGEGAGERVPFGGAGGFNPFSVLGGGEDVEGGEPRCGLVCLLFKIVEGQMSVIQGEIDTLDKELHDKQDEASAAEDDFNKKDCTEEIEDGYVVTRCKTTKTISDTDEDGNGFFLHQSVIHTNISPDDEEKEGSGGEENVGDEAEEKPDEEEPVLELIPDPVLNEIPDDDDAGIDDGLLKE